MPTDEELDALAAYQQALGRQEDFDLRTVTLNSLLATTGQTLFLDTGNIGEPGHKNCNACHLNGGGTTGISLNPGTPGFSPLLDGNPRGFNMAAGTNVNETPLALALGLPRDGVPPFDGERPRALCGERSHGPEHKKQVHANALSRLHVREGQRGEHPIASCSLEGSFPETPSDHRCQNSCHDEGSRPNHVHVDPRLPQ